METTRQQKIARLVQKDLGEIFLATGRDEFPGTMITVTKVHVTPDLFTAKVYLSIWGKAEKQSVLEHIKTHAKETRLKLGNRIHSQVRSIPELFYYIDDSLDYIENIDNLLKNN